MKLIISEIFKQQKGIFLLKIPKITPIKDKKIHVMLKKLNAILTL